MHSSPHQLKPRTIISFLGIELGCSLLEHLRRLLPDLGQMRNEPDNLLVCFAQQQLALGLVAQGHKLPALLQFLGQVRAGFQGIEPGHDLLLQLLHF